MKKAVQIIGVPIDLGQSHRGVDLGPGALRYAGLAARLEQLGYEVHDAGNLPVPVRESLTHERDERYLPSIKKVCEGVRLAGAKAIEGGFIPIFLGGDHSISIGTIAGVVRHQPTGVLWIDAHGDFHTDKSSVSGNIHGMPLALLLGRGYPELVNIGGVGATLPPQDIVSSKNAYVRFHGKNSKDWWDGQGSARYDYEYQKNELEDWMVHISSILKKAFKTYIFFNNHPGGKAPKNAKQMMKIIEEQLGSIQ
jgi:arginase family enzyme